MSTYLLIHGAWHGGWCWNKVVPLLSKAGHKVRAIDLPGHGQDKTPTSDVTLQLYVKRVCEALDALQEPVILVGHSMGGVVITQTAEYRPNKIRMLVYLTGFLLRNGECLLDVASSDTKALVMPNAIENKGGGYLTFNKGVAKEIFYGDCTDEDAKRAESLLVPQAIKPFVIPVSTTMENFGKVPRVYIECLQDRAITPEIQKKMYTDSHCQRIISMNSSHSPFLSKPEELAECLNSLS